MTAQTNIALLRKGLTLGCAIGALALTATAYAQAGSGSGAESAPAVSAADLDVGTGPNGEIVVIARKRAERLVDVPIAITAFNNAQLQKLGANDISGVQGAVPNVNVVEGRGSASSANFYIRGIGQPDALQTFDPAVGVYVDGVYLSRIQGALLNLFDVDHVEVLRGPQGTLYGKNTIGGAVNVVSKKPNLDDATGEGSFTYGRFNQTTAKGYVSAPIVKDEVALSVAGVYDHRDGIVTDPLTGRKYNDRDNLSGRAILRIKPAAAVEVLIAGDYTRQRDALTLGYPSAPVIQTNFVTGPVVLAPAYPYGPYHYQASTGLPPNDGQRLDHWGVSGTVNIDLGKDFSLSSITAYRKLTTAFYIDIDATQFSIGDAFVGLHQHQFSQELQIKYNAPKLKGVVGLYYLDEQVNSHQEAFANNLFALGAVPLSFTRPIDDAQNTKSYAAFGQATYDFTSQLSLTAGLRYTHEVKHYDRCTTTVSNFALLNGGSYCFPQDLPAPYTGNDRAAFNAVTPTVELSYKPTTDTLLYASASRGFKSGGFNGRVNNNNDITLTLNGVSTVYPYFKPEKVWTYEAGAKGSFMGGLVTASGDVFYSDYTDFQARVGNGTNSGLGTFGSFPVLNVGKLHIWGIEYEGAVHPTHELTLSASFGYLNAKYVTFDDPRRLPPLGAAAFSCNPTGTRITCKPAFAPPISARIAADYRMPVGPQTTLSFGADGRFIDKQYLSVDNRPGLIEPGYWLGNAYVQLDYRDFYLRGMVKNFSNTLYKTDAQEFSSVGNIQTVYYGDPRTWELTIGARF